MKLFVIACLFFSQYSASQTGWSVVYTQNDFEITSGVFAPRTIKRPNEKLVFNDSLGFSYVFMPGFDPVKPGEVYGREVIGHCAFYNSLENKTYSPVKVKKGNKDYRGTYVVTDTIAYSRWETFDESKMIMGYKCFSALYVNEKNDSTLVWFTNEIPLPFGPYPYHGFPGLVLEVYNQQHGYIKKAEFIDKVPLRIEMPLDATYINTTEWAKLRKKLGI